MTPWKRKEVIGNATLYLGDSLELASGLADVGVVIADPPYGVERGHGGQLRDYKKADYAGAWSDDPEYIRNVCVPIIKACVARARTVALTPGTRCLCSYPQPDDVGCFYAPASARIGKFGFQTCHPIFYYGHYKNRGKGAIATGFTLTETAEENGHPCPKPYRAWRWLVDRCAEPGATVMDPFMGSGTTGAVCADLGLPFIGIEIEPKYFDIACERIENAQRQARMFA